MKYLVIIDNTKKAIEEVRGHRYYVHDIEFSEEELDVFVEALRGGKRIAYLGDDETMTFGLALSADTSE